jgi:hypothetical protein
VKSSVGISECACEDNWCRGNVVTGSLLNSFGDDGSHWPVVMITVMDHQ